MRIADMLFRSPPARLASAGLAAALLLLGACGPHAAHAADPKPAEASPHAEVSENAAARALITVNGRAITQADVDRAIEDALGVSLGALPAEQRTSLRAMVGPQVESRLVLEILLLAETEKRAIAVAVEDVDAAMTEMVATLPEATTLEDALAQAGRDEDWLRTQVSQGLAIEALLEDVSAAADAEDDDGRRAAEEAFLRGLLEKADVVRHEAPAALRDIPSVSAAHAQAWLQDYEVARTESRATGKPILANFTGSDWCPYCVKLRREVFETEAFHTWAAENVVLLKVDFPRRRALPAAQQAHNDALQARYGVRGFPTVLFLNAEGDVEGRGGYAPGGPDAWIAGAEEALRS